MAEPFETEIVIRGAREHNLQSVDVRLPRNALVAMTGVSGSGKSSLAFDTLYAEGQRRYVESLSSYARQFLGQMPKPEVDAISGLSPSISIQQKTSGRNPRSTVGTITEVYDYLRVLFARVGSGFCPQCGQPITAQTRDHIIESLVRLEEGAKYSVLAPLIQRQKGEYRDLFEELLKQGFLRARVDGRVVSLAEAPSLDKQMKHTIEVVIDRLKAGAAQRTRLAEAVELALKMGQGRLLVVMGDEEAPGEAQGDASPSTKAKRGRKMEAVGDDDAGEVGEDAPPVLKANERLYSTEYACPPCGLSFEPPTPQLFSFNSPQGMCPDCQGLGQRHDFDLEKLIPDPSLSFQKGAIALISPWKEMGRWRRHLFEGVAAVLENEAEFPAGKSLKTPWEELPESIRDGLLYGLGDRHVTYTWKMRGGGVWKHGGQFEGIVPELLSDYGKAKNPMRRRQLEKYLHVGECHTCRGTRLNAQSRAVRLTSLSVRPEELPPETMGGSGRSTGRGPKKSARKKPAGGGASTGAWRLSLPEVCGLTIADAATFFEALELPPLQQMIAGELIKEIRGRLGFLLKCGLEYLTLDRGAPTLSGGESQRIRLAGQIGCGLVGVTYILDEPSIGLHQRDNDKLLDSLLDLRDLGNTVIVVEHDEDTMRAADYVVDFGPGPGVRGGEIVARGSVDDIRNAERSVTGQYLSGRKRIEIPAKRRGKGKKSVRIEGARHNNLRGVDAVFPLERFVCVTGVSGSGKSSLVNDVLWQILHRDLNEGEGTPGAYDKVTGLEQLDKAIDIDQSPIGRTPRSNPATYTKLFDLIRDLYTQLAESKIRGYSPGRFSFNVPGGRCEACEGNGSNKLEMDFLADVWVLCPVCEGRRFNHETLEVRFKGKSIAEVLDMDVETAMEHFANVPKVLTHLKALHDVGLDYIKLGQPSPTLSGGEAQRVKLARELGKRSTGRTIYLLDEPTTGLHFADIHKLLEVLHGLVDAGNTVLVVEHNLDVIKTADWVLDLGPEGGRGGGRILVEGTPEEVAACEESHTGKALARLFDSVGHVYRKGKSKTVLTAAARRIAASQARTDGGARKSREVIAKPIVIKGAAQHNLQHVDIEVPRHRMSVFCGPSGSGKTSLAMDTLYAEGQRRYVESLSSYARQFLGQMPKPKVESVSGLSPAIAIEQKTVGHTPRSTVGTVTEIFDYLRILWTRLGESYCPTCQIPVRTQSTDEVIERLLETGQGAKVLLLAPQDVQVGQAYEAVWERLGQQGYRRVRVDGQSYRLEEVPEIDRRTKHEVEIVVDRVTLDRSVRGRVAESIQKTLDLGKGWMRVARINEAANERDWRVDLYSLHKACTGCGQSFEDLTPHSFSFNSPLGWCPACEGLGVQQGTHLEALIADRKKPLNRGAIAAWPEFLKIPAFGAVMEAVAAQAGFSLSSAFDDLEPRQQRVLLYGTGERWTTVAAVKGLGGPFQVQYKGLYPALEEATRLSVAFRMRLDHLVGEVPCSVCQGSRIRVDAAAVRFQERTLQEVVELPLGESLAFFEGIKLKPAERKIAGELLKEVISRLSFLTEVGLEYLTLARTMPTLSGGESQRIRLAGQVGRGLTGVLYVLDEPTIGLHPRDNRRLLGALTKLRDLGNTVILVEHDREVLDAADRLYDFGPGAGRFGGTITGEGSPRELKKNAASLTGQYLGGSASIPVPLRRRMDGEPVVTVATEAESNGASGKSSKRKTAGKAAGRAGNAGTLAVQTAEPPGGWLELLGARHHNLHSVDLRIPLGTLTCITGVSGSGKSSLIEETLARAVGKRLHRSRETPGAHDKLLGLHLIDKLIQVDQQALGSTPASNPATYTGVFDHIRELYARLPDAKVRGYRPARFSFNRAGGRCEACEGNGQKLIEMHFLADVWVPCEACGGRRFNAETLEVKFHGQSIADVLEMSIGQALVLFDTVPHIRGILATLAAVGLDYLTLGQSAATLSGGEAQRVKLAAELARPQTGKTLYLLDEPTTGLHFDDIRKLLKVLDSLVEKGNTVVVIEHNLDVIKTADWLIDMGPEAGRGGGRIVAQGTPEQVVAHAAAFTAQKGDGPLLRSYTGELLEPVLAESPRREREIFDAEKAAEKRKGDLSLREIGKEAKMPWQVNGRKWHLETRMSHNGKPVKWSGAALARVVAVIEADERFLPITWTERSVVEVMGKTTAIGWFLHALTGDEWLCTLKFRVPPGTFQEATLAGQLKLKALADIDELPTYSNTPRVQVRKGKGPFQEVTVTIFGLADVEQAAFGEFLREAVAGYFRVGEEGLGAGATRAGGKLALADDGSSSVPLVAGSPHHDLLKTLVSMHLRRAVAQTEVDTPERDVFSFRTRDATMPWGVLDLDEDGRWRLMFPIEFDRLVSILEKTDLDYCIDEGESGTFCMLYFSSFGDVSRLAQLPRSVFVVADELVRRLDA